MKTTNAFSHLTLEERESFLLVLLTIPPRLPSPKLSAKTNPRLEKKSNYIVCLHTNAKCLWNVITTVNVPLVVTAHSIAGIQPFPLFRLIALLVLVMVAPIGLVADLINSNTALKTHKWIIAQLSLIPDRCKSYCSGSKIYGFCYLSSS